MACSCLISVLGMYGVAKMDMLNLVFCFFGMFFLYT